MAIKQELKNVMVLSSLIIVLLLLPSVLFRAIIINSDSLENPLDTNVKTELGIIFIVALLQHLGGYLIIEFCFEQYNFHPEQLYHIVIGDAEYIKPDILEISVIPFIVYIVVQLTIAFLFAKGLKKLILKNYLDIKIEYLPISNEWDLLLSGRLYEYNNILTRINKVKDDNLDIKNIIKNDDSFSKLKKLTSLIGLKIDLKREVKKIKKEQRKVNILSVEVDMFVNTADGDIIYKGIVQNYYVNKNNTLDKIVLRSAYRKMFTDIKDKTTNTVFQSFKTKYLVIKYEDIKNLNVRYNYMEEKDNNQNYPIDYSLINEDVMDVYWYE